MELLAMTWMVGFLTAIAVSVFIDQRRDAVESTMVADLKAATFAQKDQLRRVGSYRTRADVGSESALAVNLSPHNVATVERDPGARPGTCCIVVSRRSGTGSGRAVSRVYTSDRGGEQPLGVTSCR